MMGFFYAPPPPPLILDSHLIWGRLAFLNPGYPGVTALEQHLESLLVL